MTSVSSAGVATDRFHRSHPRGRSKTYVVGAIGRLPAATPGNVPFAAERADRASDGFGWNAWSQTRPPRELHRNESAAAENRKGAKHARRQVRKRGPAEGVDERRSGIVRRPAAPDSASATSERCRGRKPQERRPTKGAGAARRSGTACRGVTGHAAGRAGRAHAGLALVVLCARRLIRHGKAVAGDGRRSARVRIAVTPPSAGRATTGECPTATVPGKTDTYGRPKPTGAGRRHRGAMSSCEAARRRTGVRPIGSATIIGRPARIANL